MIDAATGEMQVLLFYLWIKSHVPANILFPGKDGRNLIGICGNDTAYRWDLPPLNPTSP